MEKLARRRYTLEYKQEAVRLVESGPEDRGGSQDVGIVEQTLFNWGEGAAGRQAGGWRPQGEDERRADGDQPFAG